MIADRDGEFQLILNPIRDWNYLSNQCDGTKKEFQLILNPIRDWNTYKRLEFLEISIRVPINLKPY